jgi:hypothetical protein
MRRTRSWLLILFLLSQYIWCLGQEEQDTLQVSEELGQLISPENLNLYPKEYSFFFNNAKNFSAEGYQNLIKLLSHLDESGYRPRFDYRSIFDLLSTAKDQKKYSYDQLDQLVQVLDALYEGKKSTMEYRITDIKNLLTKGVLTTGRSTTILLHNADFDIELNQAAAPTENIVEEYQAVEYDAETLKAMANGTYVAPVEEEPIHPASQTLPEMLEEIGPVIHLKKGDIYLASFADTFKIRGTEGYYLLKDDLFKGQNGQFTWENRGYRPDERFAQLRSYTFKKGDGEFYFQEAYLTDLSLISEPAVGDLTIAMSNSQTILNKYPEFLSYYANNKNTKLSNDQMEFMGGIHLKGKEFSTNSKFKEPSTVVYTDTNKKIFSARSNSFDFNEPNNSLRAENADLTIYHGNDSIFNPLVNFKFDFNTKRLEASTNVQGFEFSPFRSSFYNIEMIGDRITWDTQEDSLDISIVSARREVPLIIESKDFYSNERYNELSQIFGFHPLTISMHMINRYTDYFYITDVVDKYGYQENLVKMTMKYLKAYGYVDFDEAIGRVKVLPKAKHAYRSHLLQKSGLGYDYDDILIPSIIGNKPNATMNLKDSLLKIRGVSSFLVSDSLDVVIRPANEEIRLFKNRGIEFDGSLNAGNFVFNGKNFKFDYDSFLVRLVEIDSIQLTIELQRGERELLSNQLINTKGVIKINESTNKSALTYMPQFPIFETRENAIVDFSNQEVLGGAYDSTIYFDIPPFVMDSVADKDPTRYTFDGTMFSGGILPDFEESLSVMPDNSFGFIHQVPDSGYHLYETDAMIYSEVQLDNSGLTTPGLIDYLTGSFEIERATLFLDSLVVEKGIKAQLQGDQYDSIPFPSMDVEEYSVNWLARKDSMILKNLNRSKPFQLFEDQAQLNGQLILQTSGLLGLGEMALGPSKLFSDSISFKNQSFASRHTDFTLNAESSLKPILSSKDVKVNYDLLNQVADIEAEVIGQPILEFPYAQFITSIPAARWNIQDNLVTMSKPEDISLEESYFYTTNTALDSLAFNATDAIYEIEKKELKVKGIPYILVADAKITPEGDSLTILENAQIGTLYNAKISLDAVNNYHSMFDGEIDILSRNRFTGRATYELVNALQDTFAIQFNDFEYVEATEEQAAYTKATGRATADQRLKVSSGFIFEGQIVMYAYKEALDLEGAVQLDLGEFGERNVWIEYASNNDVKEVVIPFDESVTRDGNPLNAGIHFDDSGEMYMSFITDKRDYLDADLFVPKGGELYFNPSDSSFRIDNALKRDNPAEHFAGSMFTYNERNQTVSFEGKLDFFSGNSANLISAAGKGRGHLDSMNYEVEALIALSFGLSPESLGLMGQNLKEMGENLGVPRALDDRSELIYRVAEFIGDEATKEWDRSYRTLPISLFDASPNFEFLRDFVLSDVQLNWSKQNKAFYSTGKIGVSNVSNIELNMELDGFIEIRKTPEGDIFTMLLEMTDGTWYYFNFDGATLASFSSNDLYNAQIMTTNSGRNKVGSFSSFAATQEEVIQWATDFRKLYLGIDEPYRLLMASDSNQKLNKKNTIEGDGF